MSDDERHSSAPPSGTVLAIQAARVRRELVGVEIPPSLRVALEGLLASAEARSRVPDRVAS